MKFKAYKTLFAIGALALVLSACKPEAIVLGPEPSKLDGINDTFTLVEVTQVDENARPGSTKSMDVSAAFSSGTAATITFNSAAHTFSYSPGNAPDYIGADGTWQFDNDDYPTKVTLTNGTVFDLRLLHTIRPQDEFLEVELTRTCGGDASVSYRYKFQRN